MSHRLLVLAGLVALLGAISCGGDDDSGPSPAGGTAGKGGAAGKSGATSAGGTAGKGAMAGQGGGAGVGGGENPGGEGGRAEPAGGGTAVGGSHTSGGMGATGGSDVTGGTGASGGTTGGTSTTGGTTGGTSTTGGTTGGTDATGGVDASGGFGGELAGQGGEGGESAGTGSGQGGSLSAVGGSGAVGGVSGSSGATGGVAGACGGGTSGTGAAGATSGTGGSSAGVGGTTAGVGGSSAGTGETSTGGASGLGGVGGTVAGTGGSTAGVGGTSAGAGGDTSGTGGESAGAGGSGASAGAGGAGTGGGGTGGGGNVPSNCVGVAPDGDDTLAQASNGASPFANVQAAIDFADAHRGGALTVCVAQGATCGSSATYAGPNGTDLTMRNGISLSSDYESTTWTRCSQPGTTLAPSTGHGVYFGAGIVSPTALGHFLVRPFATSTTAAVTIDGARGASVDIELGAPSAAVTTLYGIDASNGADATLLLSGNATFDATHIVGVRSIGAKLHGGTGLTVIEANAQDVTGAWLDNVGGSDARFGFIFFGTAPVLGIHAANTPNLTLGNSSVYVFQDLGIPTTTVGVELQNDANVTWNGNLSLFGQTQEGVLLEDSPGATIAGTIQRNGAAGGGEALRVVGDATGTTLAGSVQDGAQTPTAAVVIDDCDGASPVITATVTATASASLGQGILVDGNCAPRITTSVTVTSAFTRQPQTLNGIRCTNGASCTIDGSKVSIVGGNTMPGAVVTALGVSCDAGNCPTITHSTILGLSRTGELRDSRYLGGGVSAPGATLISGNTIAALCSGGNGTGLLGSGRIENNLIAGPSCGGSFLDFPLSNARGLVVSGTADVHSNTILGGAASDGSSFGQTGCSSIGATFTTGTTFRNNIVTSLSCQQTYAVQRNPSSGAPSPLEHNDLYPGSTVVMVDGATVLSSISQVNALAGASGNFEAAPLIDTTGHLTAGSPCIDVGTPSGAPAIDVDGQARDASPDVGADEWTGAPSACFGVGCGGHGVCQIANATASCTCDPGLAGADCTLVDACAANHGGCDPLVTCTTTPGGASCGPCPSGYTGSGASGCADIDECALHTDNCSPGSCHNLPGSFGCCAPGTVYDAGTHQCVDACSVAHGGCDPLVSCTSNASGVTCGACPIGFHGTGTTGCIDDDECATNNGGCDPLAACNNLPGGFECGPCPAGYDGSGDSGCVANPCTGAPCMHGGTCTVTGNDYTCQCPPGINGKSCELTFTELHSTLGGMCGLRSDGRVRCWNQQELDDDPPTGTFASFDAGPNQVCAVDASGGMHCFGSDQNAVKNPPNLVFESVNVSGGGVCGLLLDGSLTCWGDILHWFQPPSGTFASLSVGPSNVCEVGVNHLLQCQGIAVADHGQSSPPSGTFMSVASDTYASCALRTDGTLACFGEDGNGNPLVPPAGTFTAFDFGNYYGCGVHTDGTLACWGSPPFGIATSPPSGSFRAVATSGYLPCAIATDHTVTCWGPFAGSAVVPTNEL